MSMDVLSYLIKLIISIQLTKDNLKNAELNPLSAGRLLRKPHAQSSPGYVGEFTRFKFLRCFERLLRKSTL